MWITGQVLLPYIRSQKEWLIHYFKKCKIFGFIEIGISGLGMGRYWYRYRKYRHIGTFLFPVSRRDEGELLNLSFLEWAVSEISSKRIPAYRGIGPSLNGTPPLIPLIVINYDKPQTIAWFFFCFEKLSSSESTESTESTQLNQSGLNS